MFFIDPDGMKIYNGDQVRKSEAEKNHEAWKKTLAEKASFLGISTNASRSEWRKAAIAKEGKEEWGRTKSVLDGFGTASEELETANKMYKATENKIEELKTGAGLLFEIMDNLDVDIYFQSATSLGDNDGQNRTQFEVGEDGGVSLIAKFGEDKSITIKNATIIQTVNDPSDNRTTLYVSQHELGHAHYIIGNIQAYYKWLKDNQIDMRSHDSHAKGDPSGKIAKEYGPKNFKRTQ